MNPEILNKMMEARKPAHTLRIEQTLEPKPMIVLEGCRGCWCVSVENLADLAGHHRTFKNKKDAMECIAMLRGFFEFFNCHVMVMQCITGQEQTPDPKWIKED